MKKGSKYFNVPAKIFLSKEGEWFHEDIQITHPRIIDKLNRNMRREEDGYYVTIGYERARVIVEDAPYFVKDIREEGNHLIIELSDGTQERFDPDDFLVGSNNVPYTLVKETKDRARFSRPAYYRLARYLVEGPDETPAIKIGNKTHLLKVELP